MQVNELAFTQDGKLFMQCTGNSVEVYNTATYEKCSTLAGHTGTVHSISISPDDRYACRLVCAHRALADRLRVHGCCFKREAHTHSEGDRPGYMRRQRSRSLMLSRHMASGSEDGSVSLWDLDTMACARACTHMDGGVKSVSISHDSQYVAYAGEQDYFVLESLQAGGLPPA
jgi:WD40 repeat protein